MSSLPNPKKYILLEVARQALTLAVERGEFLETLPQDAELAQPAGAFVTLRRRGRLRGCIGQLPSGLSLSQCGGLLRKSRGFRRSPL